MKKILLIIIAFIILIGGFYLFTNRSQNNTGEGKLHVAASFYPLYFFSSEIGGDKAQVTNLTAGGIEPHDYEPTAQDIAKIQTGGILIINGAGFEPWVEKIKNDLVTNGVIIVDATNGLALQENTFEDEHEEEKKEENHEEELFDPHVWLNPAFAQTQVDNITEGFIKVDPTNKKYYETNAQALKQKLNDLNNTFATGLTTCERKEFVTSHAAFSYLALQYGLTMEPIAGLSPEDEPSAQELAAVTEFAKEHDVAYIFFETLVSPKLSETIANEIGAQTLVLDPLEGISDDRIQQGENYFTVMEENLKNLQIALECSK